VIPAVGAAALVEESSGEAEHAEKEAGKATLGVARTFVGWVGSDTLVVQLGLGVVTLMLILKNTLKDGSRLVMVYFLVSSI
jgi:hypothetical protein